MPSSVLLYALQFLRTLLLSTQVQGPAWKSLYGVMRKAGSIFWVSQHEFARAGKHWLLRNAMASNSLPVVIRLCAVWMSSQSAHD